jgi:periplasmic copper chaperone A
MHRLLIALVLSCLATLAAPGAARAQQMQVLEAWTRAAPADRPAAVYLQLAGGPDRLLGVASDVAGRAELHETIVEDGVAKMRPVAGVLISPGARTRLAPGGMHIMLLDLKKPLKEGDVIRLALTFERAKVVTVNVPVQGARATGPASDPHAGHGAPARR